MKKSLIVPLFLIITLSAFPQKKILRLSGIQGFVTLACDFHEHTIFSDGEVWPTVRLDEAEKNGLDVIAFTDHIEYIPHKDYVASDLNAAWKIASEEGMKKDIIVIHGAEITRKMPPGHLNTLFIQDAGKLTDADFLKDIEEAVVQGAFIQWNHPGWKAQRPDGIPRMDSVHIALIKKGWINGIEIYNSTEFYPDVMNWCIDNNLTMTGNTDIHGPAGADESGMGKSHPPVTLVFAKSRSVEDLKNALFAGRTLVWFGDTLAGKKELAGEFFRNSLEFGKIYYQNDKNTYRYITNKTDIPYALSISPSGSAGLPVRITVPANSVARLRLPKESSNLLQVTVENIVVAKDKNLKLEIEVK
jgi:3',5'-nucleoside bisphosphate phosphatase